MKKITELTEPRFRTVHYKDAFGNRHREQEEYTGLRQVRSLGAGLRFVHYMVDGFLFYLLIVMGSFFHAMVIGFTAAISAPWGDWVNVMGLLILFLLYPFLYFVCEALWQRTPGKFLTRSIVIDEYGNKPDTRTIALRTVIRLVPFEWISMLGDDYSHGWHDSWSKTWVVSQNELAEIRRLQAKQADVDSTQP